MLTITRPDAQNITRILVDGVERYTVTMRECKVAEGVEYVVAPADLGMCGVRYFEDEARAVQFAAGKAMTYWG